MFKAYTTPPYFYDDTELSATLLKILRDNHIILDTIAQRGFQAQRVKKFGAGVGEDPFPIWRGSFQKRPGYNTAYFRLFRQNNLGENLRITMNGVQVYNAAMAQDNFVNVNVSGYTNNDVVLVEVQADHSGSTPVQNSYMLQEAYLGTTTAAMTRSWSTPVTFGTISRANLNTLVDAQLYLTDYLTAPQLPLQMSSRWYGGRWETGDVHEIGTYRFGRVGNHNRLRVITDIRSRHNRNTTLTYSINNVQVATRTFGEWQWVIDEQLLDISGYAADTSLKLEVIEKINTGPVTWRGAINTKYNIRLVETMIATGYVAPTLPTESQMLESMTFSTLQSRLNSLGTAMNTLNTQIGTRAFTLDRAWMFSRRPVATDSSEDTLKMIYPARKKRQGDVLVVRGKNIRIGWGFDQGGDFDKPDYKFSNETTLVGSDTTETKVYYLDQFDGLEYGFPYFLMGDLIEYAGEYYRY